MAQDQQYDVPRKKKEAKVRTVLSSFIYCIFNYSLKTLRRFVKKSGRTSKEMFFVALNVPVGSAYQSPLCSTDNAAKAEMKTVCRLNKYKICNLGLWGE